MNRTPAAAMPSPAASVSCHSASTSASSRSKSRRKSLCSSSTRRGKRQAHALFGVARRDFNDPLIALTSLVDELDGCYFGGLEERLGDLREEQTAANGERGIAIRRLVESRAPVQRISAQFAQAARRCGESDDFDPVCGNGDGLPAPQMNLVSETGVVARRDVPGLVGSSDTKRLKIIDQGFSHQQ